MSSAQAARRSTPYRLAVAARVLLAALGGYGVAALATALFSLILPMARSEAVATATLISFAVMAFLVCAVFAARSLWRSALWIAVPALLLGGGLMLALGAQA